jgi:ABC-type multidrug transport system fused ATPase/permease subunit
MKNYTFEYDDDKLKLKLFLISLFLFFALLIGMLTSNIFNFFFLILISLGIPYFIFWFNMKKIKKNGSSEIENEKVKFSLNGLEKEIYFSEINYYFINSHNGSSLFIKLKNGKNFGVISNTYFSNPIKFTQFCHDFETEIENYKRENNIELIRKKSFFEQAWIYPFLIILTIIILALVAIVIYNGRNFTAPFFGAIGSLMTLWSGYFSGKRKARERNKLM